MAKIPLRSYLREIESLIERGMNEEAIAHCRFILNYYPKNIETYRLLSKSFLESQRYSEAADILQRILSVFPDDFYALIGMSITREDEGNLDAAIFHMEHAYESQPANIAVQDELRRLYGRRDGAEPTRLRLSRGALVRMYARGGLNHQAIAEIRAALKEEPARHDLKLILAKVHLELGERIQAFEIANQVVTELPYCFEAIQILANILPTTSHAQDAQIYLERMISLDPYLAFISPTCPTSQQVPDNAVLVDRLEWHPSDRIDQQPAWAQTAGVAVELAATTTSPDWLSDAPTQIQSEPSIPNQDTSIPHAVESTISSEPDAEALKGELPEWMQDAGWSVTVESQTESIPPIPESDEIEAEAAKADLPDWLKEIAPTDFETEVIPAEDQEKINLLNQILPQAEPVAEINPTVEPSLPAHEVPSDDSPAPLTDTPEWLREFATEHLEDIPATAGQTIPETIPTEVPSSLDDQPEQPEETLVAEEPLPDWIKELSHSISENEEILLTVTTIENAIDIAPSESVIENNQPVLDGLPETVILPIAELPEHPIEGLSSIADGFEGASEEIAPLPETSDVTTEESPLSIEGTEVTAEEIPSVIEGMTEPSQGIPPTPIIEILPIVDSAESYFAENLPVPECIEIVEDYQPATLDTAEEKNNAILENNSDFVDENKPPTEAPIEASPVQPAEEVSLPDFSDTETALAWLESLAARHGAAEETLITPPAERLENPPDWIQAITQSELGEEVSTPTIALSNELSPSASEQVEEPALAEQPVDSETPTQKPAEMDFDTAFAWLESLAVQQGASAETLITSPEERLATPTFWSEEPQAEDSVTPTQPVSLQTNEPTEGILESTSSPNQTPEIEKDSEIFTPLVELEAEPSSAIEETPEVQQVATNAYSPEKEISDITPDLPPDFIELEGGRSTQTGALGPLPDWLQGMSSAPIQTQPPESAQPVELPDWLRGLEASVEQASEPKSSADPLPDWLSDLQPTQPTVEPVAQLEPEQVPSWIQELEEPTSEIHQPDTVSEEAFSDEEIAKFDEKETIPAGTETPQLLLNAAQAALSGGKIEISMRYYSRLIQNGTSIDETIHDLRDALYRYPVDISIWQTLGDAFLRNNQIQEALDAYTKAEEFLR